MKKQIALTIILAVMAFLVFFSITAESSEFTIERMVTSAGVENKEPVDVKDTFPANVEKVFCFIEARNITEDSIITVVWSNAGTEILKTELQLKKGSKWRTFANKNIHGIKGDWKVEVKDSQGNIVKAVNFKVE
ncbi:MAG: DUF2914 domain-containing protein [Nitrospiraceae bacterium]|nr:DUF2914 domain-containing protein [Nitrospiraceae bacterium]